MPQFERFLNTQVLETQLAASYDDSLRHGTLELDLRRVEWISPLSLSVIHCWAWEVRKNNGHVIVLPPETDCFAASFLASAQVLARFEHCGFKVDGRLHASGRFQRDRIAAFETFGSRAAFESYLESLNEPTRRALLLHSQSDVDLVTSGHLHRIALQELLDNTFVHASGTNSHYVAFEADPAISGSRQRHSLFSSLGAGGYIEVCVGDSGLSNLVSTLRRSFPPDYEPLGSLDQRRKLDPIERRILYAFEYASTSKPEERAKRIERWLSDPDVDVSGIASGLYNILSLTKLYGGQLIVRTAGRLGTIDFSKGGEGYPRIAFWDNIDKRKLARLSGTIVLLRVPIRRAGLVRLARPRARAECAQLPAKKASVGVLYPPRSVGTSGLTPSQVVALERELARALQRSANKQRTVGVLLDGCALASKQLGALLQLLARIPRYGSGLLITTDDVQQVRAAADQWHQLQSAGGALRESSRHPSFVFAVDGDTAATVYGVAEHPEATVLYEKDAVPPYEIRFDLADAIERLRKRRLKDALASPPVCSRDKFYLIESLYYTTTFYEVRRLLEDEAARRCLVMWLSSFIGTVQPSTVVYNASFLESALNEAVRGAKKAVQVVQAKSDNVVPLAVDSWLAPGEAGRVLVVLDVLCTGRSLLHRFLEVLPNPTNAHVLALVDARPEFTPPYFSVSRQTGTADVQVTCLLREPLQPIYDRPAEVSARDVVVADRVTHTLTRYPVPDTTGVDDSLLLQRADQAGGLAAGHFILKERHYIYFISFSPVISALRAELEEWIRSQVRELEATAGVVPAQVQTYCLDEETGLFGVVEHVLRGTELQSPRVITRSDLIAPPAVAEHLGQTAWFIIPGMASGATARRCLDYGRASGVKRVHVSIVTARVGSDLSRFYQGITEYRGMHTLFRFMFSLPLLSYWVGQCPACALGVSLSATFDRVGNARPRLRKLLGAAIAETQPLPVEGAGNLPPERSRRSVRPVWREARTRAEYERARWDVEARSALVKGVSNEGGSEAFAEAVGRGPSDPAFAPELLRRIVYAPDRIKEACRQWATAEQSDAAAFVRQLRGFAQVEPDVLRESLTGLFERAADKPQIFSGLLIEAARQPELFWEAIEKSPLPADDDLATALRELRDFVRRGGGGVDSAGVLMLHELRWHLVRSAGWGMPLEMIRMTLRLPDPSARQVADAFERFWREGFGEANRRLAVARNTGTIWEKLCGQALGLKDLWKVAERSVTTLGDRIRSAPIDAASVFGAIDDLEEARVAFVQVLDTIALRPASAMESIRLLAQTSEKLSSNFDVEVSSNCPSIAMTVHDFEEVMFLLLENAHQRETPETPNRTLLKFAAGSQSATSVLLLVSQSQPWVSVDNLEGGFARIRELLAHYGASIQPSRDAAAHEPFLKLRFLPWPIQAPPAEEGSGTT